ncbi:MAG TPA: DNA polymerase I [Gemmatimonadaceae bacterium]|nr:DNA polymerase I [Gemmatimonadaceae bacterium]
MSDGSTELPASPRLFLVDGYALIYRAFFALISRPLTTSRGENTSAAWGIVNFLQRLLATHKPDYLGWVHDSGLSFRHEQYPAYKATREKLNEGLQADFDRGMQRICDLLNAYRIPILSLAGYEADDVIGTLARQGADAGLNVVIVSGDKDFQQLVEPRVWLLNPGRGGPASVEEQWVGVHNAAERLGVPPERTIDYLALVGDSSDNVPGVSGIGDKTARELVAEFGALESILANVDKITKKRPREALQAHEAEARLSKELVTIRRDLPMTLDLDALRIEDPDLERLKQLYIELEFTSLVKDVAAQQAPAKPALETDYTVVDTVQALNRLVTKARKARHIAVDTETVIDPDSPTKVDPLRSRLVSISIALAPGEAYYLPLDHKQYVQPQGELALGEEEGGGVEHGVEHPALDASGDRSPTDAPRDRGLVTGGDEIGEDGASAKKKPAKKKKAAATPSDESLGIAGRLLRDGGSRPPKNLPPLDSEAMQPLVALLEDPAVRKTAQNAKYDVLALRRGGVTLRGLDFDTMLASYVLDPGRRSHGLDVLAVEFLDHTMTSYEDLCGKGRTQLPFDVVPVEAAAEYSCEDADMTLRLRAIFEPQLEAQGLRQLFDDVEVPLVCVLAEMEWAGIAIDVAWFQSLKERFQRERERVEQEIYVEAGEEFNINSNPQLRRILFEKLELPVKKRTATGPSTDASVLQELADEGHAIPELLMEYRELFKLEGTYIDTLPTLLHPRDHRLHTSFNQTVASTGRLSSSDPNLQNIPIRRELGRDIRRGFVPRKGWKLMAADYSQIELRLLAHLSQDPAFVAAFNAGGDIHRQTAAIIFNVPLDAVTKEMRARAKTINFATIYGQGAHALSRQLKISRGEAAEFIATYFERFRGVKDFLDSRVEFAREHGYAQTIFGRRRYIPELRDRNFNIRAFGERTAANSPIQGSAADLIKIAMIRIDRALREKALNTKMLLQVHDELVFEVATPELEQVRALVVHEMEHAASLSVPLVVDVGVGDNWLETK